LKGKGRVTWFAGFLLNFPKEILKKIWSVKNAFLPLHPDGNGGLLKKFFRFFVSVVSKGFQLIWPQKKIKKSFGGLKVSFYLCTPIKTEQVLKKRCSVKGAEIERFNSCNIYKV